MERVASIESESDLGFDGAYPPTKEDYIKWKEWYQLNKHLLYIDKDSKEVTIYTK